MTEKLTAPDAEPPLRSLKRTLRKLAWMAGIRRSYGKYGVERQEHLGGYWQGGDPNTHCPELWTTVVREYVIKSAIDVGCGEGYSTRFLSDLGVDVLGIEGGKQAIKNSPVAHLIVRHDYTKGAYIPRAGVDLIWCCEFVEHVEERFLGNFLATFAAGRFCLMTHAFPGQEGFHHVNCQPSEYWIEKLASIGFTHDPVGTDRFRALTEAKHVKRSLLFFHK